MTPKFILLLANLILMLSMLTHNSVADSAKILRRKEMTPENIMKYKKGSPYQVIRILNGTNELINSFLTKKQYQTTQLGKKDWPYFNKY